MFCLQAGFDVVAYTRYVYLLTSFQFFGRLHPMLPYLDHILVRIL